MTTELNSSDEEYDMSDESDLDKRLGKNKKHLRWVDNLKAGFKPPQDRNDYLVEQARLRAEEAEAEERRKKAKQGPNI